MLFKIDRDFLNTIYVLNHTMLKERLNEVQNDVVISI